MRKFTTLILSLLIITGIAQAQSATATPAPTNTIQFIVFTCEKNVIIDLTGNVTAGYDVFVQAFDGSRVRGVGSNEPLTALQQVPVSGDYQVSVTLPYINNKIVALGQYAYVNVKIARETDSSVTLYEGQAEDLQDGACPTPSYPSVDTTTLEGEIDPVTGQPVAKNGRGVYTPDGGSVYMVADANPATESQVVIGARPSENLIYEGGRTNKPGFIFAECDTIDYGGPGRIFDTDSLVVFWSWFAKTPAQVQSHIDRAEYKVFFNSEYTPPQTFDNVIRTNIVRREDGNYWVFYFVNLGDQFRPGDYSIGYRVSWSETITDGYDDFGPETDNSVIESNCTFEIEKNPYGLDVQYRNPTVPLSPAQ